MKASWCVQGACLRRPPLQGISGMKMRVLFSGAPIGGTFVLILAPVAFGGQMTNDDIEFRKKIYMNKKGEQLPYRLYVPLGYDANRKYPLVLWLHGGDGRGSDNVKQLNGGNDLATHFWAGKDVQLNFPMFEL